MVKITTPPSTNVEDRGTLDYYNADGTFSQGFRTASDAQYDYQTQVRESGVVADVAETGMSPDDAMELYRKQGPNREASTELPNHPAYEGQLPLLSIDNPPNDDSKIDLQFADPRADIPEPRLRQRAVKAGIALSEDPAKLKTEMSDAQGEHQVRQRATYKNADEFRAAKQDYVDKLITSRDPSKPVTLEEANIIQSMTQAEFTPLDPNAMEKLYAEKITRRLFGNAGNPTYDDAQAKDPNALHDIQDATEQGVTKFEMALKKAEDGRKERSQDSWGGYLWNATEQFIPLKSDWNKYDSSLSGVLPGSNMTDRIRNLWMLPPQAFKTKLDEIYSVVASYNTLDAQDMLESILSYSRMSEGVANAMFGVDVATTLPIGWIGKGIKAGITAENVARAGAKYAEKKAAEKGLKTTVKEAAEGTKSDAELLRDGWDVGEVDFPEEFRAAQAAQDTQNALTKEEQKIEETLAKSGHQEEAVDASVQKQVEATGTTPDTRDPSQFANLSNTLQGMYNPRAWLDRGSRLTREAVDRTMGYVEAARAQFKAAAGDSAQALRLGEAAIAQAIKIARQKMREEFRFANDGVIDSKWEFRGQDLNPETQTNELVMTIGTPDALAFNSKEFAEQTADHLYKLVKSDYTVKQEGSQYYIQVRRAIDERDPSVAEAMITTQNETPRSLVNTFLGWFRNPDDLLSPDARAARKIVTGAGQNLQAYFADAIKPINRLSGKQKDRLSRIMTINRDFQEGNKRGRWFDSAAEYEQVYYDAFKQYPTEAETSAYMITRELSDFDWSVRSLTILRDKSRQGIVNIHTKIRGVPTSVRTKALSTSEDYQSDAQRFSDGWAVGEVDMPEEWGYHNISFEGKLLDELPESKTGDGDPGIYIYKEGDQIGEWTTLKDIKREDLKKLIDDEGYKVYQQANNRNNPFEAIDPNGYDRQFIIMKNAQTSGLRAEDMLPYRAGYHVEYAPGFYTKVGQFFRDGKGRMSYGGDKSLMYHVSEAAAKKYTSAFEKARILLKEGNTEGLKSFLPKNLPHSYEDFVRLYSDGTLDIDTPVLYTKSGQSTRDSVKGGQAGSELYNNSRDAYNSPYNLSTFVNRQFAQEKDLALPSVAKGSEGNPVYNFVPAKMIDPLSSMSRSMHSMVKMRVYDNYQYQALTSFVEEFGNEATLGGSVTKRSLDSIRNNPLAFITDPMWNEKTLARDKLAAAKNAHRSIVNLLGIQSELNKNVDWVINKVVDSIFERWGDGAASKAADFMHTKIRDPAHYARSVAFHAKLGLFNPVQLFLQGQSIVHAAAITGDLKRSYQAAGASFFMRRLSLTNDENIIKSFAKKAKAFGWTEDDFIESFENMKAAGIWRVEGEVADLNDIFSTSMFKSKGKQFLNKGTFFFQEGERTVRLNAWNTAYKEWKKANPGKLLDNRARGDILTRYDDLAINMTRSSTGAWQQGILSVPAQFSTYQIHLMEQMLGKRLTLGEKSRVLATYSTLYGIPTGIATGLAFRPFGQDIKQAAMERGIDTNNGVIDTLLNGIMATSFEAITGREYNMSERYGPNGLTFLKEALNGKKGLFDVLIGPSGQISTDIMKGLDPVARSLLAIFSGDNTAYDLKVQDFVDTVTTATRNVSTINNTMQMFYAMNVGKFMSKNDLFTAKADAMDGVMKGFFGLDPRSVSDAYIKIESMREFKDAQDEAKKEFVKEYQKSMQNFADPQAFKFYQSKAQTWLVMGGFRPDQMDDLIRAAMGNDTSLVEKIERQYIKYAPVDQVNQRWNDYMKKQGVQ